ncbi:extracellular solute-binding protein [Enterococcus sp.]|uniref:extracellular solute-binding protein n=1 Tax=Enterococcus sp. TaxID=35783 RepID=UPI0028995813|nr:extracellular solute-binding protein [Enterococcus sp.]
MKKCLLFVLPILFVLAACQSGEETADVTGEETKTIRLMRSDFTDVRPKSEDLWMWQEYEKMSGIKVEWEEVKEFGEKKNLILSGDLPDAFYQTGWSNDEIVKYGKQGLFIPLEDLIAEHAPNLQKIFEEHPDVKKTLTAPDGHIYSLPYMALDPMSGGRTVRLYINQPWLEELSLDVPRTTEELKTVLAAFVASDESREGYYMPSGQIASGLERMIMAAYGLGTGGRQAMGNMIFVDDNDALQLTINHERMKEVWQYMRELYAEGLVSQQSFAGVDDDKWRADAAQDKVGLFQWVDPDFIGPFGPETYTPINVLEGPYGDKTLFTEPAVAGGASFIITKDAPDPALLLEWADFFYSPEGQIFAYLGEEGVTYELDEEGRMVYVEEILTYQNGPQLGAFQWVDNVYGGYFPYAELDQEIRDVAFGKEPVIYEDVKEEYMPKYMLPHFMATEEEAAEMSTISTDISTFVEQSRVKFVTGEWDLAQDWDNYVAQLDRVGAQRLLEIRRQQFDRFMAE